MKEIYCEFCDWIISEKQSKKGEGLCKKCHKYYVKYLKRKQDGEKN